MNLNLTPFYHDRAPSKEVQAHFLEKDDIEGYKNWKKRLKTLSFSVIDLFASLEDHLKNTSYALETELLALDEPTRNKFLDALKTTFAYVASLEGVTDGRNYNAFAYMKIVSSPDFNPKTSAEEVQQHIKALAKHPKNPKVVENLKAFFSLIETEYSEKEIAEVFVAEFLRQHRTHQQTIISNIKEAFYLLHGQVEGDCGNQLGWALKAGRADISFPYI